MGTLPPVYQGQLGTPVVMNAVTSTHHLPAHILNINSRLSKYETKPPPEKPDFFKNVNDKRRGKWTEEEKEYADRLIEEFKKGSLSDCENNTTLRSYLMKKLHCDKPMRITKKYSGEKIGKLVFAPQSARRCVSETQNRPTLEELERRFYKSIVGSDMEAGAKMAFAMIQAGYYGNRQPQSATPGQPHLPMPHQSHVPCYPPPAFVNVASQPAVYPSYGHPITAGPLGVTPAAGGGGTVQQPIATPTSVSAPFGTDPQQAHTEGLLGTGPALAEGNTQSSTSNDAASPEDQMDMHQLIPSLLREASSLMPPTGATNAGPHSLPPVENRPNVGFSSFPQVNSAAAAQAYPSEHPPVQFNNGVQGFALISQPQQQQVAQTASELSAPAPAPVGTQNPAEAHAYPSPMTADEYAMSAQETAFAVSQHSAYSFCEPRSLADNLPDSQRTRKYDQVSAEFLREHHKRQCLESFVIGDSAGARYANVVSASEKSSVMGTESESALASSDFSSDNGSDNASSNSEG